MIIKWRDDGYTYIQQILFDQNQWDVLYFDEL